MLSDASGAVLGPMGQGGEDLTAIGLDLSTNFLVEIKVFSTKPPESVQLFAGGSTATKRTGQSAYLETNPCAGFSECKREFKS